MAIDFQFSRPTFSFSSWVFNGSSIVVAICGCLTMANRIMDCWVVLIGGLSLEPECDGMVNCNWGMERVGFKYEITE